MDEVVVDNNFNDAIVNGVMEDFDHYEDDLTEDADYCVNGDMYEDVTENVNDGDVVDDKDNKVDDSLNCNVNDACQI